MTTTDTDRTRLTKAYERHLDEKLNTLVHRSHVAGADPTQVDIWVGWVTFEYDPFDSYPEVPPSIAYKLRVVSSWGTEILLTDCLNEDHSVRIFIGLEQDISDDDLGDLNRLLDGEFSKDGVPA